MEKVSVRSGWRVPKHDRQQSQERQHAAGESEEEELDRRVTPLLAAPDADQEEQRNQRELEEDVEQDDVPGGENAQHARLQEQQQAVISRRPLDDRLPADQHRDDHQQRRQAEEPEAQAVQTEAQAHVDAVRVGQPGNASIRAKASPPGETGQSAGSRRQRRRPPARDARASHRSSGQRRSPSSTARGQRDQRSLIQEQRSATSHPQEQHRDQDQHAQDHAPTRRTGPCRPGTCRSAEPKARGNRAAEFTNPSMIQRSIQAKSRHLLATARRRAADKSDRSRTCPWTAGTAEPLARAVSRLEPPAPQVQEPGGQADAGAGPRPCSISGHVPMCSRSSARGVAAACPGIGQRRACCGQEVGENCDVPVFEVAADGQREDRQHHQRPGHRRGDSWA